LGRWSASRLDVSVRAFEPDDQAICAQIFLKGRRDAFHWANQAHFALADFVAATEKDTIWVARTDAGVVGFISVFVRDNYIHNLFVDGTVRRRGIGTTLLTFVLERVGRPAGLKCWTANASACVFYQKRGWKEKERGHGALGEYILFAAE
jgi:GNAT superfamily N-acetyltransferase